MKLMNKSILLGLVVLAVGTVNAAQIVAADEKTPQRAKISKKAMTRISIDGANIVNSKFIDGELEIDNDAQRGQIFVRALTNKPASLFVTNEYGQTFLLILSPNNTEADSIVINLEAKLKADADSLRSTEQNKLMPVSKNAGTYQRAIKQMMVAMVNGTTDSIGIRVTPVYETIPLWQETLFVRQIHYKAADMVADSYSITNVSHEQIVLREQEFYRDGVYAVLIRKHSLAPGEVTEIYVINSPDGSK